MLNEDLFNESAAESRRTGEPIQKIMKRKTKGQCSLEEFEKKSNDITALFG
jgi:hypothetical protein